MNEINQILYSGKQMKIAGFLSRITTAIDNQTTANPNPTPNNN